MLTKAVPIRCREGRQVYSYGDKMRAIELYLRYDRSAAAVINELGYPNRETLRLWYMEFAENGNLSRWRHRRYDDLQKRAAVDHFFDHGQRLARTVRQPGYPKSKELLASWVDELESGDVYLVTLVDRASRPLVGGRSARQSCPEVDDDLVAALSGRPLETVTPDRGKKRAGNAEANGRLDEAQFYFFRAHRPWNKGTNENINVLLREFFPKGTDFSKVSADEVERAHGLISDRP